MPNASGEYVVLDFAVDSYDQPSPLPSCAREIFFSAVPIRVLPCRNQKLLEEIRSAASLRWLLDKKVVMVIAADGVRLEHIIGGFDLPDRGARGPAQIVGMCSKAAPEAFQGEYRKRLDAFLRASIALYELADGRNVCQVPQELDGLLTRAIGQLSPAVEPEATLRAYLVEKRKSYLARTQANSCGPSPRNVLLLNQRSHGGG